MSLLFLFPRMALQIAPLCRAQCSHKKKEKTILLLSSDECLHIYMLRGGCVSIYNVRRREPYGWATREQREHTWHMMVLPIQLSRSARYGAAHFQHTKYTISVCMCVLGRLGNDDGDAAMLLCWFVGWLNNSNRHTLCSLRVV